MRKEEAFTTLGLKSNCSNEMVFEAYRKTYIQTVLPSTSPSLINEDKLKLLNTAFTALIEVEKRDESSNSLLFDLGIDMKNVKQNITANFDVFPEFESLITKCSGLSENKKYGLAIRLMEIGIRKSYELNRYKAFTGQRRLIRSLGKLLIDMGLKDQGIALLTIGSVNYYIGKSFFEIRDYQSAIKYFGRELKDREAKITNQDIVLSIVKCYFLLGEYANCLHVIERVLPNFESSKSKDWCLPEKMSKILLFAISKAENLNKGMLIKFKLKLKYPVSYRCISKNIPSFNQGLTFLDEIKDPTVFNEFLQSIAPTYQVVQYPVLSYTEEELNEAYYEIFSEPLNSSLIYNKK
jgi:tetratricopeptide (TPR) repeat protein